MIHNKILSHACLNGYYQKHKKITSVAEDVEKREPSHIVDGNACMPEKNSNLWKSESK